MNNTTNTAANSPQTGCVVIIIGRRGTGKSTIVKKLIAEHKNVAVYDPRVEYDPSKQILFRKFSYMKQWLETSQIEGYTIVLEEATSALLAGKDIQWAELLISARHRCLNIFCVFHSTADCVPYFLRLADYVVLFPVPETEDYVKTNRPILLSAFKEMQKTGQAQWIDLNNII